MNSLIRQSCPASELQGVSCSGMMPNSLHGFTWLLEISVQGLMLGQQALSSLSPLPRHLSICLLNCMITVKIQCSHFLNSCRMPTCVFSVKCLCTHTWSFCLSWYESSIFSSCIQEMWAVSCSFTYRISASNRCFVPVYSLTLLLYCHWFAVN